MCNDYRYRLPLERLIDEFAQLKIPLRFPSGRPNLEPRDDIRITERAPVILRDAEGQGAVLTSLRWSWPGPGGKPVYNFRSEGRRLSVGRCLIPADGFYEFTTPADPTQKRKDKWLFTPAKGDLFAIAGLVRPGPEGEDAWTMLTCEPGPDVAPYHGRQVVVLHPPQWSDWLFGQGNEGELLRPAPAGALKVDQVRQAKPGPPSVAAVIK